MDLYQYKIDKYSSTQETIYYVCLKPIDYVYNSNDRKSLCICTPLFFFKRKDDESTITKPNQIHYNGAEAYSFYLRKLYEIPISKLEILDDNILPKEMKREKKLKNILENE